MTPQQRYVKAAHAMQSGVKADMATDPNPESQARYEHLLTDRVGKTVTLA